MTTTTSLGSTEQVLLEVSGLNKTFSGQQVLNNVAVTVRAGEIHALVGQNGSGKSTLIKILAGYHEPDSGSSILVNGTNIAAGASVNGQIGFVHQDLALVATLGTTDNIALSRRYVTSKMGNISWTAENRLARRLLADLGQHFDVQRPVGELSPIQRTCVAAARAIEGLREGARLIVLDEPTASLPRAEADVLFTTLRRLAANGAGILYVSHHLEEVLELCSRVTVLRDGRVVHTGPTSELDHDRVVSLILGRQIEHAYQAAVARAADNPGEPALRVDNLRHPTSPTELSLTVEPGEIVGLAGLDGSGRDEICSLVIGAIAPRAGSVSVNGNPIPIGDPRAALRAGLAYVPSDRNREGLVANSNVRENITLPGLGSLIRKLAIAHRAEIRDAQRWADVVQLSPPDVEASIERLSGGNQQKVVLARALRSCPDVLVLDEPTKAVDVGAAAGIWTLIKTSVADGAAVVCASVDTNELANNCHRVIVFRRGRPRISLSGADLNPERIAEECSRIDAPNDPLTDGMSA